MSEREQSLEKEVVRLRAQVNLIHDHLHHERFNEAHEACHCDGDSDTAKPLPGSNVAQETSSVLNVFAYDFNAMARRSDLMACFVAFIPSATQAGYVSVQMGGRVLAVQQLRRMLGLPDTATAGDHPG